jgi:glycosyltransferase involved in cell wall biosynthesis
LKESNHLLPLISVVIPAYNRSATIEYALNSVLQQTLLPFEVIVVDDCSTDHTVEQIEKMNSPLVRVLVQEKRGGAQSARNRAIMEAKGNWIAFHDSDDEWLPDKLEKQVLALKPFHYDPWMVVHGDCLCYKVKEQKKEYWSLPEVQGKASLIQLLKQPSPLFPSILASKKALETIHYLDERVDSFQEWDTSIRLAKVCQFVHIKEALFIYYFHQGETISQSLEKNIKGYHYIRLKFRKEIIENMGRKFYEDNMEWNIHRALENGLWNLGVNLCRKTVGISYKLKCTLFFQALFRITPCQYRTFMSQIKKVVLPLNHNKT